MTKARQQAFSSLGHQWAQTDPQGAAAYAQTLPAGEMQNSLVNTLGNQWAQNDPKAAVDWANQLPEGEARNRALAAVTSGWAQNPAARGRRLRRRAPRRGSQEPRRALRRLPMGYQRTGRHRRLGDRFRRRQAARGRVPQPHVILGGR